MDVAFNYPSYRLLLTNISESGNIYDNGTPTEEGLIAYSVVTPVICGFGILGNTISLIVLNRRELKGSVYVYLAAFTDLCSSILLFLSGLSSGVFFEDTNWPIYDIFFGLPLFAVFNTLAVFTTVMVTFDRICYLANPLQRKKPRFCHSSVARRIMVVSTVLSIIISVPYCFAFTLSDEHTVKPRPFYYSSFYKAYNWVHFIIFGVIPSIYLIIGNSYLIYGLHRLKKFYGKCNNSIKCRKPQNYTNLTTTLILIVFIFVTSQIPAMLVNRSSSTTFFFSTATNDDTCNSKILENAREISTVLNALSLSSDFILYYMFCPSFCKVLGKVFKRNKKCKPVQMNVFILDKQICFDNAGKSIKDMSPEKLFHIIDDESDRDSLGSSIYNGFCDNSEKEVQNNRDTLITLCAENVRHL